jgi:hypothetical protein
MSSSDNGRTLSAIDFLGLAAKRRVARIDLVDVGYEGVVYACDLSTAKQQKVMARPNKGKTRVYADKSMDINWSDLPADAGPKFLAECLVTDGENGRLLEAAFAAIPEAGDELYVPEVGGKAPARAGSIPFVVWPESDLVFMADAWQAELGGRHKVMERLGDIPNAVTNLVVKTVRELSGMDEADAVEEKKENF